MSRSGMSIGAPTVYLITALVLMAIVVALAVEVQYPRETASGGHNLYQHPSEPPASHPDWESKECMRDTREVRPYAFAVCYERP